MGEGGHGAQIVLAPGEGRTVQNPVGGPVTFKAVADETGGGLLAFESTVAPGEGPPLHLHRDQDEIVYVLKGELRFKFGDELSPAPAGAFVFIPRGVPHTWQNAGADPARILVVFNPARRFHEFFERFARSTPMRTGPRRSGGWETRSAWRSLGPPLAVSDPT